ncbi:putative CDP-glycerol--undecaprenyl-pyrophosphoryl-N-acetylglucosaminyl-N-acetylmannosamine glycerophosphotransferase [Carnobacterium maltaromaticum]|uniref:CDP-glycerol glycerophosphotransferase family protein n=1 Tax=Carnobacterium maltaromaticum TaxID=2751 RepID=UPI00191BC4DA|nr:CDP-glycerol glycerophosphotransferase family protein [Carnobacterium maltaromaticum]CAD5901931.1 putative CDP-glycerol--undecaprenyl-pyrophosphoryl-N-acetylglucosaminyl-N-acetylmannosamine glycerophosphotransferase [Carnobacterium maltaromaticum]
MKILINTNWIIQIKKVVFMWLVGFLSFLYPNKKKAKKKIAYLMSFPRNDNGLLLKIIEEIPDTEVVLFYEKNCTLEAHYFSEKGVEIHSLEQSFSFFKVVIFKLCQSKVIICDNYYAFLGAIHLNKKSKVIQLWHANGAIKCFGLEDKQIEKRTWLDRRRFLKVYKRFDDYIVGSKRMGEVFQRSYGAEETQIKYLGYPRTDLFFNKKQVALNKNSIYEKHPQLKGKKVILYAPTYRLKDNKFPLDINRLYDEFGQDYVLVIKAHPHTMYSFVGNMKSDFYCQELSAYKIEELLSITDCLITDYSSVPFDYSLVQTEGKIIFYWYDYFDQMNKIGIQSDFDEWNSSAVVFSMEKLITAIHQIQSNGLTKFNKEWNEFNDGDATNRFITHLKKRLR